MRTPAIIAFFALLPLTVFARAEAPVEFKTLTCADIEGRFTVLADLQTGLIKVLDNNRMVEVERRDRLTVDKQGTKFQFLNSVYSDLPPLVLDVRLNINGFGPGVSFDDKSSGTTSYKCTGI